MAKNNNGKCECKKCNCKKKNIIIVVLIIVCLLLGNYGYLAHRTGVSAQAAFLFELYGHTYEELNEKYADELDALKKNEEFQKNKLSTLDKNSKDYILLEEQIQKNDELKYYLAVMNANNDLSNQVLSELVTFDLGFAFGIVLVALIVYFIKKRKES